MEITEYKLNSLLIFPSNGKSAASISACIFGLHASEAPTKTKKDDVKKKERVQNYVCAKVYLLKNVIYKHRHQFSLCALEQEQRKSVQKTFSTCIPATLHREFEAR